MEKRLTIAVVILCAIFCAVTIWLVRPFAVAGSLEHRFDWPDETANYFWSKQFATTGQLVVAEPLNQPAQNQIHPRSFNVRDDGSLVPGSFLGLILLFGVIAKMIGIWSILYLTPLFGFWGVLAFYGIVRRIFNQKVALWSVVLLLINPAWWYYSITSLLPNVVFLSLFMISCYLLIIIHDDKENIISTTYARIRPSNKFYFHTSAAGLFTGLALSIRPSEVVWMGAVCAVILFWGRAKLNAGKIIAFIVFAVLALLPTFYFQQSVYGSWYASGYDQFQAPTDSTSACASCVFLKNIFLPFGFHVGTALINTWRHLIIPLVGWAFLLLLGFITLTTGRNKIKSTVYNYILLFFGVSIFLIIYYGSWRFTDSLTVELNTLAVSYVRYWLPIIIFSIPIIVSGLLWTQHLFPIKKIKPIFSIIVFILMYQSVQLTLFSRPDSIVQVKERIVEYKVVASRVNEVTETNAVILTIRKDKQFFPERRVIHSFERLTNNRMMQEVLSNLIDQSVPVYYYALETESLPEQEFNLRLNEVETFNAEILYRVTKS